MKVNASVIKYIPKKYHNDLVYADKFKDTYASYTCYEIMLNDKYNDKDGEPTSFIANGIEELKWAFKKIDDGKRGEIF